ncbi:MAG TPA: hypothetical protein DCL44_03735 [Elusimicrobia bacterium]|nr:hypothetical protein [Elusimicrobiota bacterium]
MKKIVLTFILASGILNLQAEEQAGKILWGSKLETPYLSWDWISSFTDEGKDTWAELTADKQKAALHKAQSACGSADNAARAAEGPNAYAITGLSDTSLENLSVCVEKGEDRAQRLREKRDKLKQIIQRSKTGALRGSDTAWLEEKGIKLEDSSFKDQTSLKENEKQNKANKRITQGSEQKFSKLKSEQSRSGGLSSVYDGSKAKGGVASDNGTVALKSGKSDKLSTPKPDERLSKKKLTSSPPPNPVDKLTDEFKNKEGYADINKKNKFTPVMAEVDKDGESGGKLNAAKAATLKAVYNVSKDFDETFINNPSPKNEDVRTVIDKIKSQSKNPEEAWQIAKQMRDKRDFPALRDAEHYLWSCTQTTGSKWDGVATAISTPLYSMAKLPGLRKIFFDDNTSPPSLGEMKWGVKGVKECWNK